MNISILLRLIFAHILADYFLQPDKLCKNKRSPKNRFTALAIHSGIHSALTYLLLFQWGNWIIPMVIFVSHFLTDWIKTSLHKEGLKSFIVDQAIHLAVIFALWLNSIPDSYSIYNSFSDVLQIPQLWIIIIGYALMLQPTSIFLNLFLKQWEVKLKEKSLPNAGRWIGYLERFLILTFILTDNIEGIGFLLAAKSIFRFGDLSNTKDIMVTEYVLIGTLSSFVTAILIGFLSNYLISHI